MSTHKTGTFVCRGEGLWAGPGENNLGEPHLKGRRRREVGRVTWTGGRGLSAHESQADSLRGRTRGLGHSTVLGAGGTRCSPHPSGHAALTTQYSCWQGGQISPSHSHPHPPFFHFWGTLAQEGIFPEPKAHRREGAKFRRLEWCGREGLGLQRLNASEPLRSCL